MFRKRMIKMSFTVLFLMVLITMIPGKAAYAKTETIAEHKVFSKKTIEKRIAEIKHYYHKEPKKLTVKNGIYFDWSISGKNINFTYYFKGKDLMFAYAEGSDKTQYRLYFYKNQLIQMLVDKNGNSKNRKTYTQLYKKLESFDYDENLYRYMNFENFLRIKQAALLPKTVRTEDNELPDYIRPDYSTFLVITGVEGTSITYHFGKGYGTDGFMLSIYTKAYVSELAKNVKIKDSVADPVLYEDKNLDWLKDYLKKCDYMCAEIKMKNGKVVEILRPYIP